MLSILPDNPEDLCCDRFDRRPLATRDSEALQARAERVADAIRICDCVIDLTGAILDLGGKEIRAPGRAALTVTRARQIAMYVCHVVFSLPMGDIGEGFGRDRTTVRYACQVIEDLRDDPVLDGVIASVERVALAAMRHGRIR